MNIVKVSRLQSYHSIVLEMMAAFPAWIVLLYWCFSQAFGLVDDAYIPMVYARNLIQGHGIVFYPGGPHVEGFTSPLWFILLSCFYALGIALPWIAYFMGIVCSFAVIFFVVRIYQHMFSEGENPNWVSTLWSMAAALLLTADIAFPAWSTAGLETTLYTLLLLSLFYVVWKQKSFLLIPLLLLGLSLTRPEGQVFVLPVILMFWLQKRPWWPAMKHILFFLVLPLLLLYLFRILYFGYPFPNSFYAKHDYGGWVVLHRGIEYIITYFKPRPLHAFAILWIFLSQKEYRYYGGILFLFLLTHIFTVMVSGGDHFALHRFMLPALPFLVLLTMRGLQRCAERFILKAPSIPKYRVFHSLIIFISIMLLLVTYKSQIMNYKAEDRFQFSNGAQWHFDEVSWAENWGNMGRWLNEKYPPKTKIAVITAGAIPYYSELPCIDIVGINDPVIAHTPVRDPSRRYVGHEKSHPTYVLKQEPQFIQLFPMLFFSSQPYPEERLEEMLHYPAQKDLWHHPLFRKLYSYNIEKTDYGYISYFERNSDNHGG